MATFWKETYVRPQSSAAWVGHLAQNYTGDIRRMNILRWSPSFVQRLRGRAMANGFIYSLSCMVIITVILLAAGLVSLWLLIPGGAFTLWLLLGATFNVTVTPRDVFILDRMGESLKEGLKEKALTRGDVRHTLHDSVVKRLSYRYSTEAITDLLAHLHEPKLPPLPDHGAFSITEKLMAREPHVNLRGTYVVLAKDDVELAFTAILWDDHRRLEPVTPCCGALNILQEPDYPRCGVCKEPYLGLSRHRLTAEPGRSPLVKAWRENDVMSTESSIRELLDAWFNLDPVTQELSIAILKGHLEWDPTDA